MAEPAKNARRPCKAQPAGRHLAAATVQISRLGRELRWQEAIACLEELERSEAEPDAILRNAVMSACEKASRWIQAIQLMDLGRRAGYTPDAFAYTSCITGCGRPSRWIDSVLLFGFMRKHGPVPSVVTCNAALGAVGRAKRWDLSMKLLRKMCGPDRHGLPAANVVTFNTAATTTIEAACWPIAVWLCAMLQMEGLQPDEVTKNIEISACQAASNWKLAVDLASRSPGVVAATTAIDACASNSCWESALALLFSGIEPNVMTFGAGARAFARGAQWQHAVCLLDEAAKFEVQLNEIVCSSIISACDEGQEWEQALVVLAGMIQAGPRPNLVAYNAAVSACAHSRHWRAALEVFSALQHQCQPDSVSFTTVLTAYECASKWAEASNCFSFMETLGISSGTAERTIVLAAGSASRRWEEALHCVQRPINMRHSLPTCNAAIAACGQGHSWSSSARFLEELHRQGSCR
ncbi:unnamed protein product [Cladocopium goreaui]|uniref:Pentatricopeptide repeat-containing protein, mitochondrial n=1 Tax=Cladocopium goreaui TaxID=2562237 RepID=A0A9P1G905_9DINO|nr:unnamed protein product [Cladocopium goreaui]